MADHVAVAFLIGEDDGVLARAFELIHLLGHEFKAREGIIAGKTVRLRHGARHFGCHDGLERGGVFRQLACALHRADEIVKQQNARLVAGDRLKFALTVAHHDADAVAVGVGAEDKVDVVLLGKVNGEIEALGILRVRGDDRGEVAVDDHLLGHAEKVLDAKLCKRLGYELVAAAVEGRVDELKVARDFFDGIIVVDHAHDVGHEALVAVRAEHRDETLLHRLVKVHGRNARENVDCLEFSCDGGGVLGRQLCAVRPVYLVAVVLLGVVRGGDVDARGAAIFAHGKRKLGRGAQRLKEPDGDAVARHDAGCLARKFRRVVAAVHADGDALLHGGLALCPDHVGKALRRPADHVAVHVVKPHIHRAAQTRGAEFERAVKTVFDLFFVVCDGLELSTFFLAQRGRGEPLFIFLTVIHCLSSCSGISSMGRIRFFASSSMDAGT